jgi:hypothetical protein
VFQTGDGCAQVYKTGLTVDGMRDLCHTIRLAGTMRSGRADAHDDYVELEVEQTGTDQDSSILAVRTVPKLPRGWAGGGCSVAELG